MGKITQYMIHCTDTPPWVKVNKSTLNRWHLGPRKNKDGTITYKGITYPDMKSAPLSEIHKNFVGRGWDRFGYHKLFHRDGKIEIITPISNDISLSSDEMTWGCSGQNANTYHVALVGGRLQNNKAPKTHKEFLQLFTYQQFLSIQSDIRKFLNRYDSVRICGHYQYNKKKLCPNFKVDQLAELLELNDFLL